MKLKSKSKYYIGDTLQTLRRELDNFIIDVYDDLRMLEPTIVDSLPKATKEYRGKVIVLSGTPDVVYICLFNGTDYEWVPYYSDVVRLSTDQTISGVKTFNDRPVLPGDYVDVSNAQTVTGHKTFSSGITVTPIERALVKLSLDQTTSTGVETTVAFDSIEFDTASGFNTTTHEYTIQNDGFFLIIARVVFKYGQGINVRARLWVNSSPFRHNHGTWQADVLVWGSFSAGDVIYVTGTQWSGGDLAIDSTAYSTKFEIVRLF